jgi:hypothetical protein
MDLLNLEKCYLSCLMNGAPVHDIVLHQGNEIIHQEIKRLKNKGFVTIPKGIIPGTSALHYNEDYKLVDYYVDEIAEENRKRAIKAVTGGINHNTPSEVIISSLREELDRIAKQSGKNEIISAELLQKKEYQNTEFIVEKIIPVGMTLLIGAPKMGKSWLLLLWAECMAVGCAIFGARAKKVPVLYYTLEDSVRRCKYRLNKLNPPNIPWSDNLYFCETSGGTIGIMRDINATGARVVIIDTFGAFSTIKDGNDYYETTKVIRELKEIADTLQVAVIVVHHTRKNSRESDDWTADVMGSQGLVGAADAVIALQRKRGENKAVLNITGRDITDNYIKIKWNDGFWDIDNDP